MSALDPRHPSDEDRLARLALSQLYEPGDVRLLGLVAHHGAATVRAMLGSEADLAGLFGEVAERLRVLEPERDLAQAERAGFRWVVPGDPEWPGQVGDLDTTEPILRVGLAPLGLWVRGPLPLDQLPPCVAVVGSRSSTSYGEDIARRIAAEVAEAGMGVVSGAAFGIDQSAHRGALVGGGPTVAVLACGVDRAYPAAHRELLDHVASVGGAVVAEVSPGRAPLRSRFLARNRVIAALSVGTVIVEAATRSGALNTANWATRLNRPLMGVPGPVTSAPSAGVHHQIRIGAATLVTGGADVLELVGRPGEHLLAEPRLPDAPRDRLDPGPRRVLEAVPVHTPAATDAVARAAGLGLPEVETTLLRLHGLGLVDRDATGWRLARGEAPARVGR